MIIYTALYRCSSNLRCSLDHSQIKLDNMLIRYNIKGTKKLLYSVLYELQEKADPELVAQQTVWQEEPPAVLFQPPTCGVYFLR